MNILKIEEVKIKADELKSLILMLEQAIFCGGFDAKEYEWGFNHIFNQSCNLVNNLQALIDEERNQKLEEKKDGFNN